MSAAQERFINKLKKVAETVAAEKQLDFFGLVHHESAPPDLWDLLVSARKLVPWSADAIRYIVGLLRKELTDEEMVRIAQVVALPRDNKLVAALNNNGFMGGRIPGLHPMDHPDLALVIWPQKPIQSAKSA
jgi:hypothetical protein